MKITLCSQHHSSLHCWVTLGFGGAPTLHIWCYQLFIHNHDLCSASASLIVWRQHSSQYLIFNHESASQPMPPALCSLLSWLIISVLCRSVGESWSNRSKAFHREEVTLQSHFLCWDFSPLCFAEQWRSWELSVMKPCEFRGRVGKVLTQKPLKAFSVWFGLQPKAF